MYEAFEETAAKGPVVAQVNNQRLKLLSRLISTGRDVDIAIFEILPHEMDWAEIQPVPWPPQMPAEGNTVLVGDIQVSANASPVRRKSRGEYITGPCELMVSMIGTYQW